MRIATNSASKTGKGSRPAGKRAIHAVLIPVFGQHGKERPAGAVETGCSMTMPLGHQQSFNPSGGLPVGTKRLRGRSRPPRAPAALVVVSTTRPNTARKIILQ